MGPHYLSKLFKPNSVAIFGASDRPESVGANALQNMLKAGFKGKLYPINPKHAKVQNQACYPNIAELPETPELAVIATPVHTIASIIQACGEKGVANAVILSAGFEDEAGKRLQQQITATAHAYGMRLLGPNCLGILRPEIGLNATFSKNQAKPGNLALVSQSGALCTAVLDWAEANDVGFSQVISTGDAADIDFGEILDFLASDSKTHSILLYIEGITNARGFISGLKAAARMKPVILLKSGRMPEGNRAAFSHTGALIGGDDVFNSAIARAGAIRVQTISQLFAAAKTLSDNIKLKKNRLAILTNGGGPGVMATDRAAELGIQLPQPSEQSLKDLDECLPKHWSHGNPIDILGDATGERYVQALQICQNNDLYDGILVMLTPQAMTEPTAVAEALIEFTKKHPKGKPIFTAWLGETLVNEARTLFRNNQIPTFRTPEAAVEAFAFLSAYHQNQQLLMQTPASADQYCSHADVGGSRLIIEAALAEHRSILSSTETRAVMHAFGIPITPAIEAGNANQAMVAAESLGFPVSLKINSPDLTHKSDNGGVKLNVRTAQEVRHEFGVMMERIQELQPKAKILGVTVEPMYPTHHARELLVGVMRDPVFGPAITFGSGGTAVEVLQDRTVALPPLNDYIANKMISQTKVAKMLDSFRGLPAVNRDAIVDVLLRISDMVSQLPEIIELDINPLFADENGVMAVDARILVQSPSAHQAPYQHMAIHPYPAELVQNVQTQTGLELTIRPIRPEDAKMEVDFVDNLSKRSRYLRFMNNLQKLTPEMLSRFTQIDYDREMALIATTENDNHETIEIAVTRYTTNPDGHSCEMAIVVRDDYQHQGVGALLLKSLIKHAKAKGLHQMEGEVLTENQGMLTLAKSFGFKLTPLEEDPQVMAISLNLLKTPLH
ncbi:bifunctional acetate--CoA ligase family protein/GNAT family N-acetyltransferase [Thiomicrorhabdus sp. ZW0627]|uniref:bifunctional acetate--CoA ligase family protein/GNAT family N-acetyltransferase n=1 Tax=Thiomicrorhabdus sp. ZW0627 TaxID=3039774 RepID=UPI00243649CD|nr:bifunctional acetate--CoA ligase family protein/GNAT family N-acetyltransferase [Thiomicrorhabdus sp. ZW0627]MDG6773722.1 bifunctional acetate--CoA ligase family protein/GNAT family N-acetyltransferase [Thiomicrorhabdus sp. ZW0627]